MADSKRGKNMGQKMKKAKRPLTADPRNREYITQATVNRLLKTAPVDRIIWDSGPNSERGFGLRVTAAGTLTFIFNYHFDSTERRYTIGRHPEYTATTAREEAMSLRVDINNGHDPVAERKAERDARMSAPTFKALADAYMEDVETQKRASSQYEDRRMLNKNILPKFGGRRLREITRDEIAKLRDSMKNTKYQA
ncbi:MAG TPA: integrase arm-type DNA-binding domain-containing protein, partial [Nitrospira sp.]|nr:integrase arm-type DNA-binding domain-containing protein [Nitrospira sp.]